MTGTDFYRNSRACFLQALLIAATTLWVYSPVFHGGWQMDDRLYLPDNPLLHDPARLWKIWFLPGNFIEYYPIEETVQWVQWQLWGNDTLGYHLTNVGLQIINALLVWRLLAKFGLRLAWLGGLIFAVHPVQVESVAWIAELKNTLSLTPFLLAMCAWMDYDEHKRPKDYAWTLGLFLIAMLCKISAAPFPALMLLYAWWKRGGIGWSDLKAVAPFLVISLTLIILTILTGAWFLELHHTNPDPIPVGGFFSRTACAGIAFGFYFTQYFWPVHLLPFYPQWTFDSLSPRQFLPWPIVLAGVAWFWAKRRSWGRHALLGLGFFFLFVAPFLGFIGISYMTFTRVMDHFLYLPIIGLIGVTVAALEDIAQKISLTIRSVGGGIMAVLFGAMAWESHAYAGAFVSREATNLYVIGRDPTVWMAHNSLGYIYLQRGQFKEASAQFEQALILNPNYVTAHNSLGGIFLQTGRTGEAIEQFEQALRLDPNYAPAYNNLGNALIQSGHLAEATEQYREALRLDPDYAEAHNGLGNALLQAGQLPEAIQQCKAAIRLKPNYVEAHCTLGLVLAQMGQLADAIAQFETALQLSPDNSKIEQVLEHFQEMQTQPAEKK